MVTDDVRAVPLVFLLQRSYHEPGVPAVVVVATEEAALPAGSLMGRREKVKGILAVDTKESVEFRSAHHPDAFAPTQLLVLLPLWQVVVTATSVLLPHPPLLVVVVDLQLLLFGQLVLKVLQVPVGPLV